jgi:hypothetical protein
MSERTTPALSEGEREFVADMLDAQPPPEERWHNFDPDFRQADIARLLRRGWFERRTNGDYREYRWTEAGRSALSKACPAKEGE